MSDMREGGCACGEVRYRLRSDPLFVHCCHCLNCQRQTGSAFVINLLIETDRVELLAGDPLRSPWLAAAGRSRRSGAARPARSRSTASTPAPGCGSFAAGRWTTRRRSRPTFTSSRGRSCPGSRSRSLCLRSTSTTTRRSYGRPRVSSALRRSRHGDVADDQGVGDASPVTKLARCSGPGAGGWLIWAVHAPVHARSSARPPYPRRSPPAGRTSGSRGRLQVSSGAWHRGPNLVHYHRTHDYPTDGPRRHRG